MPLKRHPALAGLSREHHESLLLARLLRKDAPNYKGMPKEVAEKANYGAKLYREKISKHFKEEEEKLFVPLNGRNKELDEMIAVLELEHKVLREKFAVISEKSENEHFLDVLGKTLESHIRFEERDFFEKVQEVLTDEEIETLMR